MNNTKNKAWSSRKNNNMTVADHMAVTIHLYMLTQTIHTFKIKLCHCIEKL